MIRALRKMRDNIGEFVMKTSEVSQQVAATSQQLTATSEQTATAGEEVAKTIENIAVGAGSQARDTETSAEADKNSKPQFAKAVIKALLFISVFLGK